jgi:hypothetical protein
MWLTRLGWRYRAEKTTNLSQVINKLYHKLLHRVHLAMNRAQTHNLVVNPTTYDREHDGLYIIELVLALNIAEILLAGH